MFTCQASLTPPCRHSTTWRRDALDLQELRTVTSAGPSLGLVEGGAGEAGCPDLLASYVGVGT